MVRYWFSITLVFIKLTLVELGNFDIGRPYYLIMKVEFNNLYTHFIFTFYNNGGKYLFIDEIHKYPLWSKEVKMMYDYFPHLQIVFTGSSILDIYKGSDDLSRRALTSGLLTSRSLRPRIFQKSFVDWFLGSGSQFH